MRTRERGGGTQGVGEPAPQRGRQRGGNGGAGEGGGRSGSLPTKLYFRIGEVATAVGVETHVLRYWETEFRSIRPQKSSRGQRVYSRRGVGKPMPGEKVLYERRLHLPGGRR